MSHSVKLEYLQSIYDRYHKSNKLKKTLILNEFCNVCDITRKHAIRLLKRGMGARKQRPGPRSKYPPELLLRPLLLIWKAMGEVSAKKLKSGMKEWLLDFNQSEEPELFTDEVQKLLVEMSAASMDRMMKRARVKIKGLCSTKPNLRFYNRIPIQAKDWNVVKPGYVQADTVAHCGDSLLGSFAFSLTVTDIYSGWTENRGIWTKGTDGVVEQMRSIEALLPFKIEIFKSDSGTEFMSYRLQRYLEQREQPIKMVRSRPYKKDDNCYVEQKNFTHVREIFGYERIRTRELTEMMNDIYKNYWNPLQNYFIPSTKLLRKTRIGARIKKEFEPHKTPFQRLMESKDLTPEQKEELSSRKAKLSPFVLRKVLDQKLREFYELLRRSNMRAA